MIKSKYPRVIYDKNVLNKVECRFDFPTILRINDTPNSFQEIIRKEFPYFINKTENCNSYSFKSECECFSIELNENFIAISTNKYTKWEDFWNKVSQVLNNFISIYEPVFYTKLNLKYVDIFSKNEIGITDNWDKLINKEYLGFFTSDLKSCITECKSDYTICLEDPDIKNAKLKILLGLILHKEENCFLMESNFFTEDKTNLNDVVNKFSDLHSHSRDVFRSIITEKMHNLMEPKEF